MTARTEHMYSPSKNTTDVQFDYIVMLLPAMYNIIFPNHGLNTKYSSLNTNHSSIPITIEWTHKHPWTSSSLLIMKLEFWTHRHHTNACCVCKRNTTLVPSSCVNLNIYLHTTHTHLPHKNTQHTYNHLQLVQQSIALEDHAPSPEVPA